jgi:hypothetical protein
VPLITPAALKLNPVGKPPLLSDQVNGDVPPDSVSVCEYATETSPAGNDAVVTDGAAAMTRVNDLVEVAPTLSVTFTVNVEEPAVVGVPLSTPAELKVNPAGAVPEEIVHVYGVVPPLAAKVCE